MCASPSAAARSFVARAAAFRDGTESPVAFLDRCLDAVAAHEDRIGAFVSIDTASARAAAALSAGRWASGRPLSPVDGMPVGVKDIMETADFPTGQGSDLFTGWRGGRDAAAVAALREAGAVIVGKTVTTEFASVHPGATRNPRDLDRTPGGSSSGSAAAVAAGMLPAALGTQVLGSIVRPASFCGCVGFKPSVGGINRGGSFDVYSQSCTGVLAATLADAWTVARVISARIGGDPGYPGLAGPLDPPAPVPPRRVAFLETAGWAIADDAAKDALGAVRAKLARAGIEAVDRSTDGLVAALEDAIRDAAALANRINTWETRWPLNTYARDMDADRLSQHARDCLARAEAMTQEEYRDLMGERRRVRDVFAALAGHVDACVTLSAPGPAPVGLGSTGNPVFAVPFSLIGSPAVSLPVIDVGGLPVGLQVVGFTDDDARLVAAAAAIQAICDGDGGD